MKIKMLADLVVPLKDGSLPVMHKSGDVLSVYHRVGRRLLYARQALWISREDGDPEWIPPVASFRVSDPIPNRLDRMARASEIK